MLQLKNDRLETLFRRYSHVVLFGAGAVTMAMFAAYKDQGFEARIDYIIDNDKGKDGTSIWVNGKEIKLVSVEAFAALGYKDYALLIMPVFLLEIVKQIDRYGLFHQVPTYVYAFMMNLEEKKDFSLKSTCQMRIPKKIHYCWFGGQRMPEIYRKYIESWKRHCPDYEVIEWNESNYDISKNQFMYQAYLKKSWMHVSDYARKDVIYHHGGVYLDVDVNKLKTLEDQLYNEFFMCRDDVANIATGVGLGGAKGNEVIKALRDEYDCHRFVDEKGNVVGRACGNYETQVMIRYGYRPNHEFQQVAGGVVFPREVLCPLSWIGMPDRYIDKTVAVHRFDDFLVDKEGKENAPKLRREIKALLGRIEA